MDEVGLEQSSQSLGALVRQHAGPVVDVTTGLEDQVKLAVGPLPELQDVVGVVEGLEVLGADSTESQVLLQDVLVVVVLLYGFE